MLIFVRVQFFWRRPFAAWRNFCHPVKDNNLFRNSSTPFQYHSNSKVSFLQHQVQRLFFLIKINLNWLLFQTFQMGSCTTLWQLCPVEEGAREDGSHKKNNENTKSNSFSPLAKILGEQNSGDSLAWLQKKVREEQERDQRYQAIMRNLVRRYVTQVRTSSGYVTRVWDYVQLNFGLDTADFLWVIHFSQSHTIRVATLQRCSPFLGTARF